MRRAIWGVASTEILLPLVSSPTSWASNQCVGLLTRIPGIGVLTISALCVARGVPGICAAGCTRMYPLLFLLLPPPLSFSCSSSTSFFICLLLPPSSFPPCPFHLDAVRMPMSGRSRSQPGACVCRAVPQRLRLSTNHLGVVCLFTYLQIKPRPAPLCASPAIERTSRRPWAAADILCLAGDCM